MNTKEILRKPKVLAFLSFTGLYAACLAFIFWGTWALDKAPVEPDNAIFYPVNDCARWFAEVCAGGRFLLSDLMHAVGGMYFWQELQYALAAYLAALGVVFYLRGRRLPLLASFGAGAAYGLMGYSFTLFSAGHLGWFIWLMYGPFAFGLVDRCVRKGKWRNWMLLGAVLAWSSAQQADIWLLFTALTFAYGVFKVVRESGRIKILDVVKGVALCAVVVFATGFPQFSKAITQDLASREKQIAESSAAANPKAEGKEKASSEDRWVFCTNWSLPPEDTLEFVAAEIHGGSNDPRVSPSNPYRGRLGQQIVVPPGRGGRHPVTGELVRPGDRIWLPYRQHSLYFGILTVLFAVSGIVGWWCRRRSSVEADSGVRAADYSDVPFWIAAAAIVYLCALGGFTPFYRLVFALPFGDVLRCPVKFVHLLEFCVAVLAGYGLAWLHGRFGRINVWIPVALGILATVNVLDLSRVDRKYLAIEDVSFHRAANDAADDVVKSGGGKVFVAMPPQEGARIVGESLGVHLAPVSGSATDKDVRFILASGTALRDDKALGERWRNGELSTVGFYSLSAKQGIRRAQQSGATLVLLQKKDVPPPAAEEKTPNRLAQVFTLVSVLTTSFVCVIALMPRRRKACA